MRQEEVWDDFYSKNPRAWRGNTRIPIPNGGEALDLGCGNGKTVSSLIDAGYITTGLDFSSVSIEKCKDIIKDAEFIVSSVCSMPFDNDSFDYITAVHVLEHLNDDELRAAVDEIGRVLRKDGFIFIRCFTENDMRSSRRSESDIFYRYYDEESLKSFFSDFTVISSCTKNEETRFGAIRSRVELLLKK